MSFIATLKLEDSEEIQVLNCDWQFSQMIDAVGKPVSITKGGVVHITVETDGSDFLFSWMKDPTMQKSGVITFYKPDSISKLKSVSFTDAICVGYYETFDYLGRNPQQIHLTISTRVFKMGDTTHINNWPGVYNTE